ncbi:MAG: substrate-binding domain-containing protein [Acidaminobacteraceae bacterium]
MKKLTSVLLMMLLVLSIVGCSAKVSEAPADIEQSLELDVEKTSDDQTKIEESVIILATTTSTENSGLLDYILPVFTEKTGVSVKVVAVGTGKALQMGVDGDADVLLTHAKTSELVLIEDGFALTRNDVMYNDFVLVGPKTDGAKTKEIAPDNIVNALDLIRNSSEKFVSRGDDSGTHKKELSLWNDLSFEPSGDFYISAGKGMGDVLLMADEVKGYALTDRATFLSMQDKLDLDILVEGDSKLFNQYGVLKLNNELYTHINSDGADKFIAWLLEDDTKVLIQGFGVEEFGQSLFMPN